MDSMNHALQVIAQKTEEIERLEEDRNRWKREAEHVAATCHDEIKRLQALCDEWKWLAVKGYEPQIAKLQAVVDAALDMRGIYGMSTNMEKALAALEEALWQ